VLPISLRLSCAPLFFFFFLAFLAFFLLFCPARCSWLSAKLHALLSAVQGPDSAQPLHGTLPLPPIPFSILVPLPAAGTCAQVFEKVLRSCAVSASPVSDFVQVFEKVLRSYANRLIARLPKAGPVMGGTGWQVKVTPTPTPAPFSCSKMQCSCSSSHALRLASSSARLFLALVGSSQGAFLFCCSAFLMVGQITEKDERAICYIVNTAEYCHDTVSGSNVGGNNHPQSVSVPSGSLALAALY